MDGTKAALEWHQEEPNKLLVRQNGQPHRIYTRAGGPYLGKLAGAVVRGCRAATRRRSSRRSPTSTRPPTTTWSSGPAGRSDEPTNSLYPNVADGVDGMNFITQCVASSKQDGHWLSLKHPAQRS